MESNEEHSLTYEWLEVLRECPLLTSTTEGVERLKARGMRLYPGVYADVEEVLAELKAEWRSAQDRVAKRLGCKSWRSLSRVAEEKLRNASALDAMEEEVIAAELRNRQQDRYICDLSAQRGQEESKEVRERLAVVERSLEKHAALARTFRNRDKSTSEKVLRIEAELDEFLTDLDQLYHSLPENSDYGFTMDDETAELDQEVRRIRDRFKALAKEVGETLPESDISAAVIELTEKLLKTLSLTPCKVVCSKESHQVQGISRADFRRFRKAARKDALLCRWLFSHEPSK